MTFPSDTAYAWASPGALHVAIPCADGAEPYVTSYPCTADGLAAALNILVEHKASEARSITRDHPKIAKNIKAFSEASREKAREALRALKII